MAWSQNPAGVKGCNSATSSYGESALLKKGAMLLNDTKECSVKISDVDILSKKKKTFVVILSHILLCQPVYYKLGVLFLLAFVFSSFVFLLA